MNEIKIIFSETSHGQAQELEKWLSNQVFLSKNQIKTVQNNFGGTLGFLEVIEIVLASKAIIELVKCINTWIKANRINSTIKIKLKDKEVEMSFKNLKKENQILEDIKEILKDDE